MAMEQQEGLMMAAATVASSSSPASSRNPLGPTASSSSSVVPRSNSITNSGGSAPGSPTSSRTFSSFLSRATSVTTSSVTDRLGGAVGSVKSAVGSISSQLQQVPNIASSNIERFSGNVTSSINQLASTNSNPFSAAAPLDSTASLINNSSNIGGTIQQSIGAASSTIINRTNNLVFSSGGGVNNQLSSATLFVIDGYHTDWSKYFKKAHQKSTFSVANTASTSLFSSFSSSVVSSSSQDYVGSNISELIVEQADFREISVVSHSCLSNKPTAIYVNSGRGHKSTKIVKPDYVLVRQRTKDRLDHFKNIVIGLNYGLVPMLESPDLWHIFQDKSWIFSHLSQIQQSLGRDKFPLINQIYCQSHLELVQQINSGTILYPCLLRIGASGRGKIKVDSGQMLLELASVVAMNKAACTIEQYIDARCDLLVQKIGAKSIKAYIRKTGSIIGCDQPTITRRTSWNRREQAMQQQPTSVSSSILATIQSTAGGSFNQAFSGQQQQQQTGLNNTIRQQPCGNYEPVQLSDRYRRWVEAIDEHFKSRGGAEMFSIKALISSKDDKDYIIGVSDCTMDLVGDNLDEDRRTVAELVIGQISQLVEKTRATSDATAADIFATDQSDLIAQHKTNRVPSLTGRSQSVSINSEAILTRPPLPRRGSREPVEPPNEYKRTTEASASSQGAATTVGGGDIGQTTRPSVTSFMDQTQSAAASAISSFQNKSMNFFRRLDSRQESFSSLLSSPASGSQDKLSSIGDPTIEPFVSSSSSAAPPPLPPLPTATMPINVNHHHHQQITTSQSLTGSTGPPPKPPPPANRPLLTSVSSIPATQTVLSNNSFAAEADCLLNQDIASSMTITQQNGSADQQQNSEANPDDTMKNLRKTFAGIFGDI